MAESLRIAEETLPAIWSVRTSRRVPADVSDLAGALQLEPRAWLLLDAPHLPATSGMLLTDLSHRFAVFRISGPQAQTLLASAISVIPEPSRCLRTKFAEEVEVIVQRLAEEDYRLLIDRSLGWYAADWLRDAAALIG